VLGDYDTNCYGVVNLGRIFQMTNQKSRLALIHLAKKKLNLDDDAYRAILSGAGVTSSKDIKSEAQFNLVMAAFTNLGFVSTGRSVKYKRGAAGTNPSMISKPQERYIRGLWVLASRAKDEKSLRRIVKRIGKTDDISFLSRRSASAVILALRDICWKAGFNPDRKEDDYALDSETGGSVSGHGTLSGVLPPFDGGN
jgi:hypothetical protein